MLHAGAEYLAGRYEALAVPDIEPVITADGSGDAGDPDADLTAIAASSDEHTVAVRDVAGDVRRWPGALIVAIDDVAGAAATGAGVRTTAI